MRINGRVSYIRYRPNGFIKSQGSCFEADFIHQSRVGLFVMEIDDVVINARTHYVDVSGGGPVNHVVALRPAMTLVLDKTSIIANGVDKATLTGIPPDAILHSQGRTQSVSDGTVEITSDFDDALDIVVKAFPFMPTTIRVDAT